MDFAPYPKAKGKCCEDKTCKKDEESVKTCGSVKKCAPDSECCKPKDDFKRYKPEAVIKDTIVTEEEFNKWIKIARVLSIFTIFYNIAEGVIAIYYGIEDESVSLFGFGCDSFVEVFSACIVFWQLFYKKSQNLTKVGPSNSKNKEIECERQATRAIGCLLIILALSAVAGSIFRLVTS